MEKINIILSGRTDAERFFDKTGIVSLPKLTHTPFIAFVANEKNVNVMIIDSAKKLIELPDDTPVMCQWPGTWASDFVNFTVSDVRKYMAK